MTEDSAISDIFVEFYSRLFTSSMLHDIERVLEGVQSVVSSSMNVELTKPYTREEVDEAILSCLNSSTLLKLINHTFITRIPKVNNPKLVYEFRPISLCNVIYKILSKVIENRLKPILNSIISEAQSALLLINSSLITS